MSETANRPAPLDPPERATRADPATFAARAEPSLEFQFETLPSYIEDMASYIEDRASVAAAGFDPSVLTEASLSDAHRLLLRNAGGDGVQVAAPGDVAGLMGLGDLRGVAASSPSQGDSLIYTGESWQAQKLAFASVKDAEPREYTQFTAAPGTQYNASTSTFYVAEYADLAVTFTPSMVGSTILIDAMISHEQNHNAIWFMTLDNGEGEVELGSASLDGGRNYGHAVLFYDNGTGGTMTQSLFKWDFQISSQAEHTLRFFLRQANNNALKVNKSSSDLGSSGYERAVSYARVQEIPGTPFVEREPDPMPLPSPAI